MNNKEGSFCGWKWNFVYRLVEIKSSGSKSCLRHRNSLSFLGEVLSSLFATALFLPCFAQGPNALLTKGRPNIVGICEGRTVAIPILSDIEQLAYVSVLISTSTGNGTGFFVQLASSPTSSIPALVTNKHVIGNSPRVMFEMTVMDNSGNVSFKTISISGESFLPFPDNSVDLCWLPLISIIRNIAENKQTVVNKFIDVPSMCVSKDEMGFCQQLDEVFMVGCPSGIWDEMNRNAIFRRGVIATNPSLDIFNQPLFLVDIPTWFGSSGSPLFVRHSGFIKDKFSKSVFMTSYDSIKLIGVATKTMIGTARGKITTIPIPTRVEDIQTNAVMQIPNGIGVFIKAEKLIELDTALRTFTP